MQIVHFGHACTLVETDSARLLFDPGTFSTDFETLTDLDAVVITHQHFDHIDIEKLPGLLKANPKARLIIDPGTLKTTQDAGLDAEVVNAGDTLSVGGTKLTVVGGDHAEIHRDIPLVPNTGHVVDDGAFYHPGDSFHVPQQDIDVLALPTGAPWLKVGEAVDFFRAVAPRIAVPIHEAVLASPQMHYRVFSNLAPSSAEVRVLDRSTPTAL
jgi:L-ascorbate metabolism protein UlaG (beta-lactamase superfamily)